MSVSFEYGINKISEMKVETVKTNKKNVVSKIIIADKHEVYPTKRFWKSLHQRFRFSANIFKYFSHEEIFKRISERAPNDKCRWCIEKVTGQKDKALALTNPNSPVIQCHNLMEILGQYNADKKDYAEGVVRSTHVPKVPWNFEIGGDNFVNRFIVDTPIDGHGKPAIYVSLLRVVCSNGMVGFSPAFRTELNVGKKNDSIEFSLCRALESFNNEEAYAALQERIEHAQTSWASVHECMGLHKAIVKVYGSGNLKGVKQLTIGGEEGNTWNDVPVLKSFAKMTGDLNRQYGLANIDALSLKKQRTLPASCTVYDMLNFVSETATHHATAAGNRTLQAFLGGLIANEYDLEGTKEQYADWKDFFISNDATAQTLADMSQKS
jgi:hypothetical protein